MTLRLPDRSGSQEWPIATSTIARYLALSKKGSRCFPGVRSDAVGSAVGAAAGLGDGPVRPWTRVESGVSAEAAEAVGEARIRLA